MKDQKQRDTSQVCPPKETAALPEYEAASRFLLEYREQMMLCETGLRRQNIALRTSVQGRQYAAYSRYQSPRKEGPLDGQKFS